MASNALTILGEMFYEPSSAFAQLKDRSRPWLPLLLLTFLSAAVMYWFCVTVDFTWFIDHMIAANPDMQKPEAQAAMRRMMTPSTFMMTTVGASLIMTPLITAVIAIYYLIAAKVMGSGIGYGRWFGFVAWISVPRLLTLPLMALQIATAHGKIAVEELNMVSLNYLVFHLPASNHWFGLVNQLDLASIWTMVVSVIGLRVWTGRSSGTCVTVALLPWVLIYGIWAAKIAIIG